MKRLLFLTALSSLAIGCSDKIYITPSSPAVQPDSGTVYLWSPQIMSVWIERIDGPVGPHPFTLTPSLRKLPAGVYEAHFWARTDSTLVPFTLEPGENKVVRSDRASDKPR
ncbi:MAG: hypothetical protein HYZ09_04060 [Candidatus Kerfeldbacteria bacterium]|nr:hypothetical protein [Candidatus Kerfeldbacteria bacterium]